ncbi:MAG: YceI family protein [Verrucomicrobia bacterium]|nr:YceI family protein [Verrucomicrobiota bacterium]MDA1005277.1 YceI family protein [Verrucomicrobiota bacterium]
MKSPLSPPFLSLAFALGVLAQPLQAAEFVVDPAKSAILVDVKATGHDFTAKLTKYKIKITGDANSATPKTVDLSWDFKNLPTGDVKRDDEMLKWLEHAAMPSGSFNLSGFATAKDGSTWAKGTLRIHGVRKIIQFPVTTVRDGSNLQVSGTVRIDHQDFKLGKIRKLLVLTVNPIVTIRFNLKGSIR